MKEGFEFRLEDPLQKTQVNIEGENTFIDLDKLYLKAPCYKHRDHTIVLKKMFIEAVFGMTASVDRDEAQNMVDKSSDDNRDDKLEAQAVKAILYASKGFDISTFYKKFLKFFAANICYKDESHEQILKPSDLEKLEESDLENLVAQYIEVFFIVSWMKALK